MILNNFQNNNQTFNACIQKINSSLRLNPYFNFPLSFFPYIKYEIKMEQFLFL